MMASIHTCGRVNAWQTSRQLKSSISLLLQVVPSSFNCAATRAFSLSFKKRACAGERGKRKNDATPNTTVKRPSRMKIQAQPGRPPIPFILIIPYARRPEKAPDREAVEKKADTLQLTEFSVGKKAEPNA
jgi:hypothetical protein